MHKVMILTDSTADLSQAYIIKNDIATIPLFIRFNEEIYLDGIDMTPSSLYHKVEQEKVMAKSSGLRSADFNIVFKKYLTRGYDIVYIGVSSKLSGSFQSAEIARNSMEKERIFLVDSLNLSAGLGLLVAKAVDLRNEGLPAIKIKEVLEMLIPKVRSYYIIPSLDYLYIGRKINGIQKTLGKIIGLKPIIAIMHGQVKVYKKPFGSMEKLIGKLVAIYEKDYPFTDTSHFMVTQSLAAKCKDYLLGIIHEHFELKDIIECDAGCVISCHTGKGTLGIAYLKK